MSYVIITDACFLIDVCKTDKNIFKHLPKAFKKTVISKMVLNEITPFSAEEALDLGFEIIDDTLADLFSAQKPESPLSLQDRLCMIYAERHQWTCVTNDKKLIQECRKKQIPCMWGLETILELYRQKMITKKYTENFIDKLMTVNNRISLKIKEDFLTRLNRIFS